MARFMRIVLAAAFNFRKLFVPSQTCVAAPLQFIIVLKSDECQKKKRKTHTYNCERNDRHFGFGTSNKQIKQNYD